MVCGIAFVNKMKYYVYKNILNGRYSKMKVQIEVGKGIQCDGIEIMFGDSISFVVEAYGEIYQSYVKLGKFTEEELYKD